MSETDTAPLTRARTDPLRGWPVALAAAAIASQILWVLVPQSARDAVTITAVALFAAATISHATATRGSRWAMRYSAIALGVGWLAEAIGTTTGWPFGEYSYSDSLGAKLGPVPIVIPLAWLMMSYPVLLAARRVAGSAPARVCYAAALLTAWDLFLDPQMVAEGHWTWSDPAMALPGIPGIPAQNYLGWLLVGLVLFGLCETLLDKGPHADDRVPASMLLWVFASNVLASAAFWGRPLVALLGGAAMGLLLLPWLRGGVMRRRFWLGPAPGR